MHKHITFNFLIGHLCYSNTMSIQFIILCLITWSTKFKRGAHALGAVTQIALKENVAGFMLMMKPASHHENPTRKYSQLLNEFLGPFRLEELENEMAIVAAEI